MIVVDQRAEECANQARMDSDEEPNDSDVEFESDLDDEELDDAGNPSANVSYSDHIS